MSPQVDDAPTFLPPALTPGGVAVETSSGRGEPAWDVAKLFPMQGDWTEAEYLALDNNSSRIIELRDGFVEVHPVATLLHQLIVLYLCRLLDDFVRSRKLGVAVIAPCPVRLKPRRLREPDVFFVRPERIDSLTEPSNAADLVMEVVSEGAENRQRDFVDKRAEYAEAKIPEYWIVDPENGTITVLSLGENSEYAVHAEYRAGQRAGSLLLPEFSVDVAAVFAAGEMPK